MESFKAHESYITQSDWRVKENSNNIDSFGAYQKYLVGEVNAEIMRQVYGQDLFKHHDEGFYHIHDISSGLCNYCFGGSLETLFSKGISGVANLANSSAPEHFDSACNQIASSILGYASEISGAVAYSSINTYLAPFVRRDKLLDSCKGIRAMRQSLQNLIFNLNQNTRFSSEPCFSNFTLDLAIPVPLRNKPVICGSDNNITTYGEYEEEAKAIALMLLDIMLDGDTKGNSFTYPLITVNIASQEDFESPVIESASELSAKTGNCYFANFINSSLNANDTYSLCCRLRIDRAKLIQKQGLFGAQANTGSIGVVTLSLPMIARKCYENNDDTSKFLSAVKGWAFEAAKVLIRKRKVITERFDAGFYPHLKQSLPRGFATFFSTIGLIGMAEAYEILTGLTYTDNANSKSFATSVIDTLNEVASICQELPEADGALFNVEASPAESACFSLARKYNKVYNDNEDDRDNIPYFTNSSNLSVDKVSAIWRGAKFYDNHLSKYTGGSVFHILCDDKKITGEQVIKAVKHLFSATDIPYLSITPTMYRCEDHGHSDTGICKECGKECETLTRITGYVRSVGRFNTGKLLEHGERKYLDLASEIERY